MSASVAASRSFSDASALLRLARLRQRFDRLLMQALDLDDMPLLILESSDEQLVGAIGQVHRRDHQNRLPVLAAIDHHSGYRTGAARHHERDAAPQELFAPHLDEPLSGRRRRWRRPPEAC